MSEQQRIEPSAEVRDPVTAAVVGSLLPKIALAGIIAAIVGCGSGIIRWTSYEGLEVKASPTLTLVGLTAICWVAGRILLWSLKSVR